MDLDLGGIDGLKPAVCFSLAVDLGKLPRRESGPYGNILMLNQCILYVLCATPH